MHIGEIPLTIRSFSSPIDYLVCSKQTIIFIMTDKTPKEVGIECRFAYHISENPNVGNPDLHLVKEVVHYDDGTKKPRLRLQKDFERPYYIVKRNKRNFKDKKDWISLEDVNIGHCTQSRLRRAVAKALEKGWSNEDMRSLSASPYLHGTDITSTSLLKKKYQDNYPDLNTPYSVSTFDIETDTIVGHGEPIMASAVFLEKKIAILTVTKEFVQGIADIQRVFKSKCNELIGEDLEALELEVKLIVCENAVECIRELFKHVHDLKPDWLAIWNMDFDIPKILELFKKYDVDPRDILCDPSVPSALRFAKYKQGPKKKTTASGKVMPINPAAQWHTFECAASFYVIDAMCAYKHLRLGEQEEVSYSLDYILQKKIKRRKLKFEQAEGYFELRWHQFMQTNYKVEYMVYNLFDSLSMQLLDRETKDLSYTLPTFAGVTDFWNFKSQPRRIADAFHFFVLGEGSVLGTVPPSDRPAVSNIGEYDGDDSDVEEDEDDDEDDDEPEHKTLSLKGWIVTLPSHMSVLGLPLIQEDPTLRTGIRGFGYDSDATAAYPSATSVANVARSTTKREIIDIQGVDEELFRMQNLNLILGEVNANEYCQYMMGFPSPQELLATMETI
jgi:hypothetical protein